MTPTNDEIDGVIIANLVIPVESQTSVTVTQRRAATRDYGEGATWIRVREFGVTLFLALRSARGWEFAA